MELQNYVFSVSIRLILSRGEVEHIIKVATKHYDARCREFAEPTGVLTRWLNWDLVDRESGDVSVEWKEVDTICKILEQEHLIDPIPEPVFHQWHALIMAMKAESERVNYSWMVNDASTFTQEYRDTLRKEHGDPAKPSDMARKILRSSNIKISQLLEHD